MASFFGPDANQQADQAVKFMRERGQNPVQYGFTGTQQERDSWEQGVQARRSGANSQQASQPQASTAAPKASGGQSAPNMSAYSQTSTPTSAYSPGRARPITPASTGTPYNQQAPQAQLRETAFARPSTAQAPMADQSGYDKWSSRLRSEIATGRNPRTADRFEQRAREQWGKWTQPQRDWAVRDADRRSPNAARANTTSLPFADYTDPNTGEKFLADSTGRLRSERDIVNFYSSNGASINPERLAKLAAQYHDAGVDVPSWLQQAAQGVNGNNPTAWYDLMYLDKRMWDSADEGTRYRIRGGQ